MSAGVYQINIGPFYYIGSSKDMKNRACNHLSDLKHGRHHNINARAAYAIHRKATWAILRHIPWQWGETESSLKDKLCAAEQEFISIHHGKPECLNISRTSRGATCPRPDASARWKDPVFREMMKRQRDFRDYHPSEETKVKMSEAKRGKLNPKARPVVILFEGVSHPFDCTIDAARYFGVSQQVMEGWLANRFPWPGLGTRESRAARHLTGIRGEYAQTK